MAKKGKKKGSLKLDFEGVESGGGRAVADGTYPAKIDKVEEGESSEGNPMLKLQYVLGGKAKGARLYDNISLLPQALWRMKTLLEVTGEEDLDGDFELDPEDLVGKELEVEVTNEKWQGKDRPKVTGYGAVGSGNAEAEDDDADDADDADDSDDDEDDKKSKKGKKDKKAKKGKKDEEEDDASDEKPDADAINDMDEEELAEVVETHELDVDLDGLSVKKARKAVIAALEDAGDDADDSDDDDDKPAKKGKKDKAEKKGKSKFKSGQKVSFTGEKGKTVKGVIVDIDGDTIKVEDKAGEEWEVDADDLTAA